MAGNLTGTYFVKVYDDVVFDEVRDLFPKVKDRMRLRRQSLKLRFWPSQNPVDESGKVLDLDWSPIKSLPHSNVGELRISDVIGGRENLRVIFFVGSPEVCDPKPLIWILTVLQKKRNDFTVYQIRNFKRRRQAVIERFYNLRL
jgi:hypothetical protein